MMQLSKRLQAVADMVTKGYRTADIGCDHGYIAIYLIESGISPLVIAMDINQGPLDQAKENIYKAGYTRQIEVRYSDGANQLMENEVDSIICAGMGGRLTIRIIQADLSKLYNIKELILQPQSEIHLVRRFLSENGFLIVSENMIYEDGKYYPIMKAVPNHGQSMAVSFHKEEVLLYEQYGALLLNQKNRILLQYLQWKQSEIESITQQIMKNSGSETRKNIRLIELSKEKAQVKQALQYFEGE